MRENRNDKSFPGSEKIQETGKGKTYPVYSYLTSLLFFLLYNNCYVISNLNLSICLSVYPINFMGGGV